MTVMMRCAGIVCGGLLTLSACTAQDDHRTIFPVDAELDAAMKRAAAAAARVAGIEIAAATATPEAGPTPPANRIPPELRPPCLGGLDGPALPRWSGPWRSRLVMNFTRAAPRDPR